MKVKHKSLISSEIPTASNDSEVVSSKFQSTIPSKIKKVKFSVKRKNHTSEPMTNHKLSNKEDEDSNDQVYNRPTPEVPNKKTKKSKKKKKEVTAPDSQQLAVLCAEYLNQWKNERSDWKFVKVKQIRLVSNMFDEEKLPDESFSIFIEYVAGGSESLKKLVTSKANEVIAEMEKWQNLTEEEKSTTPKMDDTKYSRARSLLQNIA